jgi:hypothetical protein
LLQDEKTHLKSIKGLKNSTARSKQPRDLKHQARIEAVKQLIAGYIEGKPPDIGVGEGLPHARVPDRFPSSSNTIPTCPAQSTRAFFWCFPPCLGP